MSTNENDRELLKLAAKAAGFSEIDFLAQDNWANVYDADGRQSAWNPLFDDGDALRLAVALDLDVFQAPTYREVQVAGALKQTIFEKWEGDKIAATRRAIVRAAAEIATAKGVTSTNADEILQQMVERKHYVVTRDETQYHWDFGGFHAADTYNGTMGDESKWLEVTRKRAATMLAELVSRSNQQQKP